MSTTGDLDIDVLNEREEGELEGSDVEEGAYIPLQRPETFNPPSLVSMQIQDELSDEPSPEESSGSESDEGAHRKAKRTKLHLRPSHQRQETAKQNKYNVWCKTVQEDVLTEDMFSCDVTKKKRFGVESFDCTIKYKLDDNYVSKKVFTNDQKCSIDYATNKRRHGDRNSVKLRLGKRINSNYSSKNKHAPRYLPDLNITSEDPLENIAEEIANKLAEEKRDLVGKIVQVLGASKAVQIYKETQRVEADGGMLVMNGTRRRTPGGIFLFLSKHDEHISQAALNKIFNEDRKETERKIKKAQAKSRQKVMEQLKQSLTDSELPLLLSRGEATTQSEHGSNPPPSPATDARDCSSDTDAPAQSPSRPCSPLPNKTDTRQLQDYDDDFLEVMCNDDMDMF